MPQIFRIGPYIVYFCSNENDPLEPVHVHIAEGRAGANATKIWISSSGKALLCNNNSNIPNRQLSNLISIIEANRTVTRISPSRNLILRCLWKNCMWTRGAQSKKEGASHYRKHPLIYHFSTIYHSIVCIFYHYRMGMVRYVQLFCL